MYKSSQSIKARYQSKVIHKAIVVIQKLVYNSKKWGRKRVIKKAARKLGIHRWRKKGKVWVMFMKQSKSQKEDQQRSANEPSIFKQPPLQFMPTEQHLAHILPTQSMGKWQPRTWQNTLLSTQMVQCRQHFFIPWISETCSALGRFCLTEASGTETKWCMSLDMRLKLSRDMGTHCKDKGACLLHFELVVALR
jgi:hypothetical protein